MATEEELQRKENSYRRQISSKENQIKNEQAKIDNLEDEIARLKRAYSRLENLEDGEAKDLKTKTKVKNATSGYSWRGKNKNDFDDKFESEINPDATSLKEYIDGLMDSINWAIHDRQKKINGSGDIISGLMNGISWLKTCIQNLWN